LPALTKELADQVLLSSLYPTDYLRLVFTVGERKIASKEVKKLPKNGGLSEMMKTFVTTACEC